MVCPICLERWAPFPGGDYRKKRVRFDGHREWVVLVPVSQAALERRESEFWRDEEEVCAGCGGGFSLMEDGE
jgi:hypothetical protein